MKQPPFKTVFSSRIRCVVDSEKDKYLSLASLDNLKAFIPNLNLEKNVDLLAIAADSCVVNRFNKNGDGIDGETALAIADLFVNKQINANHARDKVCGVILSYNFSEFGTSKILDRETVTTLVKENKPFNLVLGGVLWRVVNEDLTDYIEASNDPQSEHYMLPSFSWEIGFSEEQLVLIKGESRNVEDGELLTQDKSIIYNKLLKANGGNGKLDDNTYIYRLVKGWVLPMGIGITEHPAADVKGIAVATSQTVELENTSQSTEIVVNTNRTNMKMIKKIEDLNDETLKEVSASQVRDFIQEELKKEIKLVEDKSNEEKQKQESLIASEKAKLETLAQDNENLKKENEKISTELSTIKTKLAELEHAEQERAKLVSFSARMGELDSAYSFEKAEREVISQDIRDLDDNQFSNYKTKLAVLLKNKVKASDNNQETSQSTVESVIDNGKKDISLPNTVTKEVSLAERMKNAFSGDNAITFETGRRKK